MWVKVHKNQNIFSSFFIFQFIQYLAPKKFFGRAKNINPSGIRTLDLQKHSKLSKPLRFAVR